MIILEILTVAIAALVTVGLGGPLIGAMSKIKLFPARHARDEPFDRPTMRSAYFEPLDFGEDTVKWPSEVQRVNPARPLPAWPSETWGTDAFPRSGGMSQQPPESAPPQQQARAAPSVPPQDDQDILDDWVDSGATTPVRTPPRTQQRPPPSPSTNASDERGQIEALIAERGLAGAVQHLMQRNNWDFRTAAAYLAKHRN